MAQLLPHHERDADVRASFFSRLELIFYAAAALPQELWERLETVSTRARGEPVMLTSSWGLTETAPLATSAHFQVARAGVIGVPVPGVEIKMTPVEDKHELRVRGPNVTPGYLGRPDPSTRRSTGRAFIAPATPAAYRTPTIRPRDSYSTAA